MARVATDGYGQQVAPEEQFLTNVDMIRTYAPNLSPEKRDAMYEALAEACSTILSAYARQAPT